MGRLALALGAMAVIGAAAAVVTPANASVLIDVFDSGANLDVTATGSLDLTGATFERVQGYTTGMIPGGSNWYVSLGTTAGNDLYQLTGVSLPFGSNPTFFLPTSTSGDAITIWGQSGQTPLVGVSTGYASGTPISAAMEFASQSVAGMSLIPGTYVFSLPNDTIKLKIEGASAVPEPGTWAMMLLGAAAIGVAMRGSRRKLFGAVA